MATTDDAAGMAALAVALVTLKRLVAKGVLNSQETMDVIVDRPSCTIALPRHRIGKLGRPAPSSSSRRLSSHPEELAPCLRQADAVPALHRQPAQDFSFNGRRLGLVPAYAELLGNAVDHPPALRPAIGEVAEDAAESPSAICRRPLHREIAGSLMPAPTVLSATMAAV